MEEGWKIREGGGVEGKGRRRKKSEGRERLRWRKRGDEGKGGGEGEGRETFANEAQRCASGKQGFWY